MSRQAEMTLQYTTPAMIGETSPAVTATITSSNIATPCWISPIQMSARPRACLVLQGSKRVAIGTQTFYFSAGESLLITSDVPTVSQVTRAITAQP